MTDPDDDPDDDFDPDVPHTAEELAALDIFEAEGDADRRRKVLERQDKLDREDRARRN